jgi:hypothetical protein
MKRAPLHLYILSKDFLDSGECQREFGQSLQIVRHGQDICSLLVPGCQLQDLDERYSRRNCIVGDNFMAYPRLLDRIHNRLSATGTPDASHSQHKR